MNWVETLSGDDNTVTIIKVIAVGSDASTEKPLVNVRHVYLDPSNPDIATFERHVNSTIKEPNDYVSTLKRIFGVMRTPQPLFFIIYGDYFSSKNTLDRIILSTNSFEFDRYVFRLLVGGVASAEGMHGVISSQDANNKDFMNLMREVAESFSNQRRKYAIFRGAFSIMQRSAILFALPILAGVASGLGEGFITRQIPNDRFIPLVDVLFFYLIFLAILASVFPLTLFLIGVMSARISYRKIGHTPREQKVAHDDT